MPKKFSLARANSLRPAPILQLLLVASLVAGIGVYGHSLRPSDAVMANMHATINAVEQSAPARALTAAKESVATAMAPVTLPQPINSSREAELEEGQSFADMLADAGASEADATAAMNALSKIHDLRKMKAGQIVTLSFTRTDQQETLTGAIFQPEATKEVVIQRLDGGVYTANMKLIPMIRQRVAAQGEIRNSLYEAGDRQNVPHAIMASLIRIYSHDIDFQRDIHPGDKFEVLYDQPTTVQGKAVGEGDVIYAALTVSGKIHPIYRVTFSDKTVDFFNERGQSVRRTLLRTPVAAAHITSGFGMRMHPLLGYSKMHKGVDFGATVGTPIFAAGNGVIDDIGFRNGYGRYIRIRHSGSLETAYAHMSRFGSKMYQGARVNQGEVIGYVGMSGRATGPHLHFEVVINGRQANPMSVNMPTGRTLDGKLLADFRAGQLRVRQEYNNLMAKKNTPVETPKTSRGQMIQASSTGPAFAKRTTQSCGLRGGC